MLTLLAQVRFDLRRVLLDKALYATIALLAVMLFVPLFFPPVYQYPYFDVQFYRDANRMALESQISGAFESAPEDLREMNFERLDALGAIVAADKASDDEAKLEAMLSFEQCEMQAIERGYAFNYSRQHILWKIVFLEALLESENYQIYETADMMPAPYYLASLPKDMPWLLWFLPAIVVFSRLFSSAQSSRSRSFDALVPIPACLPFLSRLFSGLLVSLTALGLAVLPVFVWVAAHNGLGNLSYPVIDMPHGALIFSTLGTYLTQSFALITAGSLLIGAVILLVSCFTDTRLSMAVITLILVLVSYLSVYQQLVDSPSSLLHLLPTSYFNFTDIIGITAAYYTVDQNLNVQMNFGFGIVVLALSSLVVLVTSLLSARLLRKK
ncbi:MAG: hypothetical protein LBI64_01170 [Coriobacteriales bacterium]|nr:hypothetical protein [Coriobacteriales bacterium]